MTARIGVVMSVCNGQRYLREAVDSILGQSLGDFELIIIDDASTDATPEVLSTYTDARIRLHRNASNLGLTKSLNIGLAMCRTKYIARMDADDVSSPRRFERQVELLESRRDVGVCGTHTRVLGERRTRYPRPPTDPPRIAAELLFGNCMSHASVMLRRQVLVESGMSYDESLRRSQDYELWTRLSSVTDFAIVPEPLLRYRKHGESISSVHATAQKNARAAIALQHLRRVGARLDPVVLDLHADYMQRDFRRLREPSAFSTWALGLLSLAAHDGRFEADALVRALSLRVAEVFRWPSRARAEVAARLMGGASGSAPFGTIAAYGLAAACVPAPAWSYLRYG